MATLTDYHAALDTFMASPSETAKRSVLGQRAKLPDSVSVDGVSVALPNGPTLESMLDGMLSGSKRAGGRKRLISTGVRHEG